MQVAVQADDVRRGQQFVDVAEPSVVPSRYLLVDPGIRRQHFEAEGAGAATYGLTDAAEPDEPQRPAGEALDVAYLVPAPVTVCLHLLVIGEQAAVQCEHECQRMVRDFLRAVLADAADANAACGRGRDVHAIPTGGSDRDDAAAVQMLQDRVVERHVVRQDRVGVATRGDQRLLVAAVREGRNMCRWRKLPALDREVAPGGLGHFCEDYGGAAAHAAASAARLGPTACIATRTPDETSRPGHSGSIANTPPAPASAAMRQPITVASERVMLENAASACKRFQ